MFAQTFGVSQPLSVSMPTPEDVEATKKLEEALAALNVFETDEELQKRVDVLSSLNNLVADWIRQVSKASGIPKEMVSRVGGRLHPFGSYGIGAHTRGADIDTVCVAPQHVQRSDFFSSFLEMLKADENATDVHAVESAFVPVIKLNYCGIDIDMLFARLNLEVIPDDLDFTDTTLLQNMDEQSVRSLNGLRFCKEILNCVPDRAPFTIALRAIKVWAKNRSIYSNTLGFLGGVSWAILTARICQLYPNAAASTIVEKFFLFYTTWKWPNPILLKHIDAENRPAIAGLNTLVWNPHENAQDRFHVMPIITPTYPEQNSTYNATKSTRKIIMDEMVASHKTVNAIALGTASWAQLLEPTNFFSRFRHFVVLQCLSDTKEGQMAFSGLVESRIRKLVVAVERCPFVSLCHVNPKQFVPKDSTVPSSMWFLGMEFQKFPKGTKVNIDMTKEFQQFSDIVLKAAVAANFYNESMLIKAFYKPRPQLQPLMSTEDLMSGRHVHRAKEEVKPAGQKRKAEVEKSVNVKKAKLV